MSNSARGAASWQAPVLVIGLCLAGVGGLALASRVLKGDKPKVSDAKADYDPLVVRVLASGSGNDGLKRAGIDPERLPLRVGCWARLMFEGRPSTEFVAVDEEGKTYPVKVMPRTTDTDVFVPMGYRKTPKRLTLRIHDAYRNEDLPVALPPLAPPPPRQTIRSQGSFPGLKIVQDKDRLTFDAPIEEGNLLAATCIGTSLVDRQGPNSFPRGPWRAMDKRKNVPPAEPQAPDLYYPNLPQTLALKVEEYQPTPLHLKLKFPPMEVVERFGAKLIAPGEVRAEVVPGIEAVLQSTLALPSRPTRKPLPIVLTFFFRSREPIEPRGFKLIGPTSVGTTPVKLSDAFHVAPLLPERDKLRPPSESPANGISFTIDLNLTRFKPLRSATIPFDWTPIH